MSFKAGPLGCVIQEDWTLESDENIAKASGQSPFFGANPNTASFVGRWNELKSRGVKAVFLWEGYEKIRSLVPHHQLSDVRCKRLPPSDTAFAIQRTITRQRARRSVAGNCVGTVLHRISRLCRQKPD